MKRKKISLLKKGDVIRTNPEDGFYGIAVVLDDGEKFELSPNKWSYPMCHIAITPLIYDYEVTMEDVDLSQIYPMRYMTRYNLKNTPIFYREVLLVHIYTTRNVDHLSIIGNIDPSNIFQEDLSWNPRPDRFHLCGNPQKHLGREAYLSWLDRKKVDAIVKVDDVSNNGKESL